VDFGLCRRGRDFASVPHEWTVNAVLDSRKQSFTKVTHPHSHNPAGEPLPVSFLNLSVMKI